MGKKRSVFKVFLKALGTAVLGTIAIVGIWAYAPDITVEELKKEYANSPSSFIEVQGMEVHYRMEGKGTPLVLLHGTGASLHTWDAWTEILGKELAIIRLDLPAFGLTGPHPQANYDLQTYVAFVDEFMRSIGIDKFALAGNSLGGAIAWNYAATYPNKVSELILVDPSGLPSAEPSPAVFKIAQNPIGGPLLKLFTPRAFIEKNLKEVYHDDSKIKEEVVDRYWRMARRTGNRQAFIDRTYAVDSSDPNLLEKIQCRTLILWGNEDIWTDPVNAPVFEDRIPNAQLIMYENVGHIPMEEIPSRSAADVLKFLFDEPSTN